MFRRSVRALGVVEHPFAVLGLPSKGVSLEDLKHTYLELVKVAHPDRPGGKAELMKDINIAYKMAKEMVVGKAAKPCEGMGGCQETAAKVEDIRKWDGVVVMDTDRAAPLGKVKAHVEGHDPVYGIKKGLVVLGAKGQYRDKFIYITSVCKRSVVGIVLNHPDALPIPHPPPSLSLCCGGPIDYDILTLLSPTGVLTSTPTHGSITSAPPGSRLLAGHLHWEPIHFEDQLRSHHWKVLPYGLTQDILRSNDLDGFVEKGCFLRHDVERLV